MHFEYVASSLDLAESLWTFEIAEQIVAVPFLLVGQSHDPAVTFDRSHINFRSVLVGQLLLLFTSKHVIITAAAAAAVAVVIADGVCNKPLQSTSCQCD